MSAADITAHIEELESYGGRGLGPRVIARAWADPEYKKRLMEDGVAGVNELGIEAGGWKPYGGVTGRITSDLNDNVGLGMLQRLGIYLLSMLT